VTGMPIRTFGNLTQDRTGFLDRMFFGRIIEVRDLVFLSVLIKAMSPMCARNFLLNLSRRMSALSQ
jgi:hypothetical protein